MSIKTIKHHLITILKPFLFIFLLIESSLCFSLTIETYAVSPDHKTLALAYDDYVIRLYDLSTGALLHELKSHEDSIQTVNFNQDGSQLISGDWGDRAILWNTRKGKVIKKRHMSETVMHASFSKNDQFIIMAIDDRDLAIFDNKLNRRKGSYPINDRLQISSQKDILAGQARYSQEGEAVYILDLVNNKQILKIPEDSYDDEIYFNKDASIVVIRDHSSFNIWSIKDQKKIGSIDTKLDVDTSVINTFNEQQLWLTDDNLIEIWDYSQEKILQTVSLDKQIANISDIVFSEDGHSAFMIVWLESGISKVMVLNTQSFEITWTIATMGQQIYGLQFLNPHQLLIHATFPIEIWNTTTKTRTHVISKQGNEINKDLTTLLKAEFNPYELQGNINAIDNDDKGHIIITGAESAYATLALDNKGYINHLFQNNFTTGYDARYSHNGQLAAFAYHGEHLLIYNTINGELYSQLDLGGVPNGLRIVKFSADDKLLAAGSDDGSVYIIDVANKKQYKHISFLTDGEYSEGTFSLQWIGKEKLLVGTLENIYEVNVNSGEFKKVWDVGATALQAHFEQEQVKYIAVGQYEKELIVLNADYEKIKTSDHSGIGRLAVTDDGKKLIALADYQLVIWDIDNNKSQLCVESDYSLWAMSYDKNNHKIYIGGDEGIIHVYNEKCKNLN